MKQRKKPGSRALVLGIWLLCMLAVTGASERDVLAGEMEKDGFVYNTRTYNNTAIILEYVGNSPNVIIPEEIDGYKVTGIERYAFYQCTHVTSVFIPSTVTSINEITIVYGGMPGFTDRLFEDCPNLESIIVDENNPTFDSRRGCNAIIETYSNTLLEGCKTTKIPANVTELGDYAFAGCTTIDSIFIPENVKTLGTRVFRDCRNLSSIEVDVANSYFESRDCNAIISKRVSGKVGNWLLVGCKNTTIPTGDDAIAGIGSYAFDGCSQLKTIKVGKEDGICIATNAFNNCHKDFAIYVNYGDECPREPFEYSTEDVTHHRTGCSGYEHKDSRYVKIVGAPDTKPGTTPGSGSTPGTSTLPAATGTTLKDSSTGAQIKVTSADAYAPTVAYVSPKSKNTKKVVIPGSVTAGGVTYKVTSIANNAFKGNKKITRVTIPDTVKTVGKNAFKNCTKLTKVTIGTGVTKIQTSAFEGCKALKTVTVKSTKLSSIGKDAFRGTRKKLTIKVPKSMVKKYKTYFKNKGNNTLVIKK